MPVTESSGALALYLAAAVALVLTPGPDTVYVLTRGAARGRRVGVFAALGVSTGVLVHTTAAALGLAALLRTSDAAFTAIEYAGAVYLIYLGGRSLLGDDDPVPADGPAGADGPGPAAAIGRTHGRAYLRGVAVNVLNPKVALFFLAFLPQFAGDGPGVTSTMLLLGALYAVLTACYLGGVGALAGRVGGLLREDPRFGRALRRVSGTVLVGLGVALGVEA